MEQRKLTLGSLFDGSGGFPLGGILAGIEPKWSSEIEPFPVLVTHKRLPGVKHYGDVSRLSGAELPPVDIITFGSPCQDLSIAGKRAGIHDGDRSNLFFQAIRIIKEMRDATNGRYPRYCVWENVPGAFSSHGGDDFKAVLEAVIGIKEEGIEVPSPENHRWPKS
ncbi:MAG: DNA cytosine methyltransferase, partial [Ruminococcus flavefaciens]